MNRIRPIALTAVLAVSLTVFTQGIFAARMTPAAGFAQEQTDSTTSTAPMSESEKKAQKKTQKHDETAAKETARADKDTAKASKAKAKEMKHQDKATRESEKAQPPQ